MTRLLVLTNHDSIEQNTVGYLYFYGIIVSYNKALKQQNHLTRRHDRAH
jgi:hypothetical protein